MNIRIWVIFGIVLSLVCSAVSADQVPVFSEGETHIKLDKFSPEFRLKLKSNPTTGYSWFLQQYDKRLIKPVGHDYLKPDSGMVGQGGYEIWTFSLLPEALNTATKTKILMVYKRPWEVAGGSKDVTFTVTSG